MAETTLPEAIAILDRHVRQGQRRFTLNEAAVMTGVAIDTVRQAMEALLTRYTCRLQVSEHGDLVYDFGETLHRRGKKTAAEHCREIYAALWKAFTVVYKAWISLFLVVYFGFFFIVLFFFALGEGSEQPEYLRRRSWSPPHGGWLPLFLSIFRWRTTTGTIAYQHDAAGYRYQHYEPQHDGLNPEEKSLSAAVYDFVFGPPRVAIDPLTTPREMASYVRLNKGLVVPAELCALAGWTFPQAETFLTDCVIHYHGEVKISDQAVLYGQFDDLMRGVGEADPSAITYYWDEYEPEYELTGNSVTYNRIIVFMNGFTLLCSWLILMGFSLPEEAASFSMTSPPPDPYEDLTMLIHFALGRIPFIFSVLFFLIPLVRAFHIRTPQRQRQLHNIRKRMYKAIFARRGAAQSVDEMMVAVNTGAEEAPLPRPLVEAALKTLALDLQGDMLVTELGDIQFVFPRITAELDGVANLRRSHVVDDTLGDIVIDSDN